MMYNLFNKKNFKIEKITSMRTKDQIDKLFPNKLKALVTPRNNEGRIRFIKHNLEANPFHNCATEESNYNSEKNEFDAKGSRVAALFNSTKLKESVFNSNHDISNLYDKITNKIKLMSIDDEPKKFVKTFKIMKDKKK